MDAAPKTPDNEPFDFGAMASMNSTTAEVTKPDDDIPLPSESAAPVDNTNTAEPVKDDEDDLVIGGQLDAISPVPQPAENAPAPSEPTAPEPVTVQAPTEGTNASGDSDAGSRTDENNLQNPHDPRLAAGNAASQQAAAEKEQMRRAPQSGGGNGPGIGGAIAGAGAGAVSLVAGGFKLLRNGVKNAAAHDESLPKRMSVAETLANRDPKRAAAYYENAGDKVVAEKFYRQHYNGLGRALSEARDAERAYQESKSELRDVMERSPLKELAKQNNTSIGDLIHGVKGGTIKDAAMQTAVQNLLQDKEFTDAEEKTFAAANNFAQKRDKATMHMEAIDTSHPDRADTNIRRQELSNLSDGMKDDEVSKASNKMKKVLDEIESMASALKAMIKKTIEQVGSMFKQQPK